MSKRLAVIPYWEEYTSACKNCKALDDRKIVDVVASYGVYRAIGGKKEQLNINKIDICTYEYYIEHYIRFLIKILYEDTTYRREAKTFCGREFRVLKDFRGNLGDIKILRDTVTKYYAIKFNIDRVSSIKLFRTAEECLIRHADKKLKEQYNKALTFAGE